MRSKYVRISPLAAVLVLGAPARAATVFEGEPIATIGHGELFDAQGDRIEVTPEFVEKAQSFYRARLLGQASPTQRAEFESKQASFFAVSQWDAQSELYIDTALLSWLAQQVAPPRAAALTGKLELMKRKIEALSAGSATARLGPLSPFSYQKPALLESMLMAEGLEPEDDVFATNAGGQAYSNECNALDVPTPPTWGSSQWHYRGNLSVDFIGGGSVGEVYTYKSTAPEGSCIALPRSNGNTIGLLGIICLGKTSSVACFWDNQNGSGVNYPIPKGTTVPISQFRGGADLEGGTGGDCTDCHAGENPYIIHPGTSLGLPNLSDVVLRGDDWYFPLVADSWPQNLGPTDILASLPGGSACTSCHQGATGSGGRFPQFNTDLRTFYCNWIVRSALQQTMPQGNPGAPDEPLLSAILAECNNPPVLPPPPSAPSNWQVALSDGSRFNPIGGEWLTGWATGDYWQPFVSDFNGDGRSDLLVWFPGSADGSQPSNWQVALSDGSRFNPIGGEWLTGWATGDYWRPFVSDFNGDGRSDLLVWFPGSADGSQPSNWQVALSDGSRFNPIGGEWLTGWATGDYWQPFVSDFNGDGRSDLLVWFPGSADGSQPSNWQVALSDGSRFNPIGGEWLTGWATGDYWRPFVSDFNGDGRSDLLVWFPGSADGSQPSNWQVALSDGSRFNPIGGEWLTGWATGDYWQPFVSDFNGDGRSDLLVWFPGSADGSQPSNWQVALSDGSRFAPIGGEWLAGWATGDYWRPFVSDFNGDGRSDLLVWSPGG